MTTEEQMHKRAELRGRAEEAANKLHSAYTYTKDELIDAMLAFRADGEREMREACAKHCESLGLAYDNALGLGAIRSEYYTAAKSCAVGIRQLLTSAALPLDESVRMPREPTEAMLVDGARSHEAALDNIRHPRLHMYQDAMREAYKAMLKAADGGA